jgi:hypothetical protein
MRCAPSPPAGKVEDLPAGAGVVWMSVAMPPSVGLLRAEPATGRLVARISGSHLFGQVAVGNGTVWTSDCAAVTRINPAHRSGNGHGCAALATLRVRPLTDPQRIGLLAVAPGVVWVSRAGINRHASVMRLDPRPAPAPISRAGPAWPLSRARPRLAGVRRSPGLPPGSDPGQNGSSMHGQTRTAR